MCRWGGAERGNDFRLCREAACGRSCARKLIGAPPLSPQRDGLGVLHRVLHWHWQDRTGKPAAADEGGAGRLRLVVQRFDAAGAVPIALSALRAHGATAGDSLSLSVMGYACSIVGQLTQFAECAAKGAVILPAATAGSAAILRLIYRDTAAGSGELDNDGGAKAAALALWAHRQASLGDTPDAVSVENCLWFLEHCTTALEWGERGLLCSSLGRSVEPRRATMHPAATQSTALSSHCGNR